MPLHYQTGPENEAKPTLMASSLSSSSCFAGTLDDRAGNEANTALMATFHLSLSVFEYSREVLSLCIIKRGRGMNLTQP